MLLIGSKSCLQFNLFLYFLTQNNSSATKKSFRSDAKSLDASCTFDVNFLSLIPNLNGEFKIVKI
jgi:hypothetical protein